MCPFERADGRRCGKIFTQVSNINTHLNTHVSYHLLPSPLTLTFFSICNAILSVTSPSAARLLSWSLTCRRTKSPTVQILQLKCRRRTMRLQNNMPWFAGFASRIDPFLPKEIWSDIGKKRTAGTRMTKVPSTRGSPLAGEDTARPNPSPSGLIWLRLPPLLSTCGPALESGKSGSTWLVWWNHRSWLKLW